MINSAPRKSNKYRQGLFVPKNKEKVLKLNNQGGLFYRSGLEYKYMIMLDNNPNVIRWGAEILEVPYTKVNVLSEGKKITNHTYYPDFYYEFLNKDGTIKKVVVEVKPYKETQKPVEPTSATSKKIKNYRYDMELYIKNISKWAYVIEFCNKMGFEFAIVTEKHLK